MNFSTSENGYSKNGGRHDSSVDPSYHASGPETRNDAKCSSPNKSKLEIDNIIQKNAPRHGSSETGKQTENLIQDFEEESKANHVYPGSRYGKSKALTSSVGEVKRETLYVGYKTAPGFQKGDITNEHPVQELANGDVAMLMRNSIDTEQINIIKNFGFEFESNETYFDGALKFLHGASLLENCHSESGKHDEEMNQMQIYGTAAKLFKSCAHEYERRQEMAATALAYKCMKMAYMRDDYCKSFSTNRDRHELQSTLQMVSQGESPSSSAFDVDNLNNQMTVDKATFPRGTNTHVSGLRRVIDFSFLDVDELVHLVLVASNAIRRAALGGAKD
ncbi:hypothetical protein RIF29_18672 [Crotalaria pallida]|uniref:CWZF3/5/7 THD domain-containing protein n=1 Tax=Crotalaria pallida TaxID=3830 RepID=A0AAN9I3F0_CROPI